MTEEAGGDRRGEMAGWRYSQEAGGTRITEVGTIERG